MGCVIFRGNKVISVGFNKMKSHPEFATEDRFYSLHAEMDAIIKAKQDLSGCIMYVYREYKDGGVALAKPCILCMPSIIESGIKKVFFTDPSSKKDYSIIKLTDNSSSDIVYL
jgi:deoxycytidylate deaminase